MQVIDCEQGSPEWFEARRGVPTASEFSSVIAKGRGQQPSKVRETYMMKLAGEILTGDLTESFSTLHAERGKEMEDEVRDLYGMMFNTEPQQVGFIRNGQRGYSPDATVGDNGLLEIKTKLPHLLVPLILVDEFPEEHKAQCQGGLLVSEREWIDIAVYWPKLPLFHKRAYRDEKYIKELSDAIDQFNDELAEVVERVRSYGSMKEAA